MRRDFGGCTDWLCTALLVHISMIFDVGSSSDWRSPVKQGHQATESQENLIKELKATLGILEVGVESNMKAIVRQALEIANEIENIASVPRKPLDKENLHPNAAIGKAVSPTSKTSFDTNKSAPLGGKKSMKSKSRGIFIFQDQDNVEQIAKTAANKRTTRRSWV